MKKPLALAVIVALVVGTLAFYGGMKYGQSKAVSDRSARFQQFGGSPGVGLGAGPGGRNGRGGNRQGMEFVVGELLSKDEKSLTVKLRDGGSKIVFLSGTSTPILKTTSGSLKDLVIGEQVTITGSSNPDGSVSAQSIQLRPPLP